MEWHGGTNAKKMIGLLLVPLQETDNKVHELIEDSREKVFSLINNPDNDEFKEVVPYLNSQYNPNR